MVMTRRLGRWDVEVPALGVGTWAMGGPFRFAGQQLGWGSADDAESIAALRKAFDLGVRLFDTSDAYGAGHAERLLAVAFSGHREEVVLATKWGYTLDAARRELTGEDATPQYLRRALTASLQRLGTDYVDIYQLHLGDLEPLLAAELRDACEGLVREGLVRCYGWSTDDPARAAVFAEGPNCAVVQAEANVLRDRPELYELAEQRTLALLCRSPLAMGLLADRDWRHITLPANDIRGDPPEWLVYFHNGRPTPEFLARRDAVRDILTGDGRTLTQGALAWLWARNKNTVPIPGCRTVRHVEETAAVLERGPLTEAELLEIEQLLRPVHSA
ncbi:aldo/keto reductase [Allokutzneria sp. A3M-2-11 16]|uniref:aldo/keto reductase n=1 Tax=Allokutzneria sp. A3M-2-11 16 TaxID=2962043 RepID=UPI0020B7D124|nr:aldo/keto reductase [Allokutzneria sp. A3M-2-11 16]MCP3803439.1 aldo/keto reductase [Allokutzneria sp. A3M-2-11 16]